MLIIFQGWIANGAWAMGHLGGKRRLGIEILPLTISCTNIIRSFLSYNVTVDIVIF
jgi:hypothetical protein